MTYDKIWDKSLKRSHYNKISKTTEIEVAPKVVEILLKVGKQKRCILAKVHFSAISDFYRGPFSGIKWLQVTHSWLGAKIKKALQLVGSKSFGGWKTIGRDPKTLKQNQIILKLLGWDGRSPVRKQKNLSSGQTLKSMKIKTDLVFERRERKKAIDRLSELLEFHIVKNSEHWKNWYNLVYAKSVTSKCVKKGLKPSIKIINNLLTQTHFISLKS